MKKTIFLADDSITIQKVVELTFSEGDYEVVCVGNGAAAMQRVAEVSPDIALLDVIMPERSGYDVCTQIKKDKDLAWTPVILLTGAFEPYDEKRAREAGADGHMTKPFESRALVTTVEGLLQSRPRPGQVAAQTTAQSSAPASLPSSAGQPAASQTVRMKAADIFAQVPAGPAAQPAPQMLPHQSPQAQRAAAPAPQHAPQPPAKAPTQQAQQPQQAPQQARRSMQTPPPAPPPVPRLGDSVNTPAASTAVSPAGNGGARAVSVPPEMIERAVKEAVAGISEKIIREVAWEVIPDLAEAIIQRRIRELEEEAGR